MLEGGSACGEIIGHSKAVNAVAIRSKRPFRAATGGDDGVISFMTGVPFKYSKTLKSHTSFINDLAFSPDGDLLASVGGDGKVFLYDGAEGETKASAGDKSSGSLVRRPYRRGGLRPIQLIVFRHQMAVLALILTRLRVARDLVRQLCRAAVRRRLARADNLVQPRIWLRRNLLAAARRHLPDAVDAGLSLAVWRHQPARLARARPDLVPLRPDQGHHRLRRFSCKRTDILGRLV